MRKDDQKMPTWNDIDVGIISKDFKAAFVKLLQWAITLSKQMETENCSKEVENIENQMKIL